MKIVNEHCRYIRVRARNITKTSVNLAIEVKAKEQKSLISQLMQLEGVISASPVEHDGEVTV